MLVYLLYHIIAFGLGFVLDLIVGDPRWFYHPVCIIGNLIGALEKHNNKQGLKKGTLIRRGLWLVLIVIISTVIVVTALIVGAYWIHPAVGIVIETILTSTALATKSLRVESKKVQTALESGDLEKSRYAVSMIVGRDTASLDEEGVAKAAVETVAENASDGVIAPMLYMAIGGPILGYLYKSINTMDSMVGYHSDRYEYYGKVAAQLDDVVNYIPARLSGLFIVLAAAIDGLFGKDRKNYSGKNAWKIFRRDRRNHKSPNSAQTESACAGALSLQLAGPAWYFGKLHEKPTIGDAIRPIESKDIARSHKLLYTAAAVCFLLCYLILWGIYLYVWL